MDKNRIDLADFEKDATFYGQLELIVTVKSFDLQAIRKRYIVSRKNRSGKAGSVERRTPSLGGIVILSISEGAIVEHSVLARLKEPRGIALNQTSLAIAAENEIFVITESGVVQNLQNDWFSYIHTVQFHPENPHRILISSSGLDLIFEYDLLTDECTYEWLAWEHGFNTAIDPSTKEQILLTRNKSEAERLSASGNNVLLIDNPAGQALPTAKRAAFINSCSYKNNETLLATFFHEGKVYAIDKASGTSSVVMDGLKNPHGGQQYRQGFLATSTAEGEVVIQSKEQEVRVHWPTLPGKESALGELEWVQNTHPVHNFLVAIDSNRTSFIIFDPHQRKYDQIPYPSDWAIQDFVHGNLTMQQEKLVASLTSPNE